MGAALNEAGTLPPQPWMTAPATRAVIDALTAEGTEVRFVGGCVRDAVLGRPAGDIDIATPDRPEDVIRLLESAGLKAVPTGIKHGTVTAVAEGTPFEITTLREDVETDGRHAKVAFTDDWAADAGRRDFTMNALLLAPDGTLFDYVGGLDDLRAGRVRFVGEAAARIREDVLRLLRFFRFQAHYGTPPPDAAALAACGDLADLLPTLSAERVAAETFKTLAAPAPAEAMALMDGAGVLPHFLPEARRVGRLAALTRIEGPLSASGAAAPDTLRRLAALLEIDEAGAQALAKRLNLSNARRDRLAAMVAGLANFVPEPNEAARRRWLYRHGGALYRDLSLLHWAAQYESDSDHANRGEAVYRAGIDAAAAWEQPSPPVKGADVLALGVPNGPRVGALLAQIEQWWIDGDFRAGREAALQKLRAIAESEET